MNKEIEIFEYSYEQSNQWLFDEWSKLSSYENFSFFLTPAWAKAWELLMPKPFESLILVAKSHSGECLGILPLVLMKRKLHRHLPISIHFWGIWGAGTGGADHIGVLSSEMDIGIELIKYASKRLGSKSLYLESLSPEWASAAIHACGGKAVRNIICPANVRADNQSFADAWSKKMHKNQRRRLRILSEENLSFRWVSHGDEFGNALKALKNLHESRWNADGGAGLFSDAKEKFLLDVASFSTSPNIPWILLLEKQHKAVGGLLGFRKGKSFSVYKTGWDPECANLGIGIALGAEAMRWAEEQGITVFDYLRGPRSHKHDLGCMPFADQSILFARGIIGLLLSLRERFSEGGIL